MSGTSIDRSKEPYAQVILNRTHKAFNDNDRSGFGAGLKEFRQQMLRQLQADSLESVVPGVSNEEMGAIRDFLPAEIKPSQLLHMVADCVSSLRNLTANRAKNQALFILAVLFVAEDLPTTESEVAYPEVQRKKQVKADEGAATAEEEGDKPDKEQS